MRKGITEKPTRKSDSLFGEEKIHTTRGSSRTSGSFVSESETSSWSDTESHSEGQSEALLPILEERPTQVFNLEEQIYKAMALMVNQPTQHAIIKLPKQLSKMVKTPTVTPGYARAERVTRFKENCYQLTEFVKPQGDAEKQINTRRLKLEREAGGKGSKEDPESFRE